MVNRSNRADPAALRGSINAPGENWERLKKPPRPRPIRERETKTDGRYRRRRGLSEKRKRTSAPLASLSGLCIAKQNLTREEVRIQETVSKVIRAVSERETEKGNRDDWETKPIFSCMEKINFSGGEPFLYERGEFVGKLVQFCKEELKLPSVSIVTNGSMIKERWFKYYGDYLDILAVSCDSFDEEVNDLIGRGQGKKNHVKNLEKLKIWCQKYSIAFKINSVINRFNVEEDMNEKIKALNPVRWKIFQCLLIEGENTGEESMREAEKFIISDEDFERFVHRHKDLLCLVPESNQKMRDSYLILDEYMRFLSCVNGRKEPSRSILDVGVKHAIQFSGFDENMFFKRGGKYVWSKADMALQW